MSVCVNRPVSECDYVCEVNCCVCALVCPAARETTADELRGEQTGVDQCVYQETQTEGERGTEEESKERVQERKARV